MVSVTLSGPKGISGKGGCLSLFIWDVGLGNEVSVRKIFAHLGSPGAGWLSTQHQEMSVCLPMSSAAPFGFTGAAHWLQS